MAKRVTEIKNAKELREVLKTIPYQDKAQRNSIVCSLIGHSRIQSTCFGYFSCARCEDQLGDTLAGVYPFAEKTVIVGHDCKTCRTNWKECTWKDKIYVAHPFTKVGTQLTQLEEDNG